MFEPLIRDAVRTPIVKPGGALATVRADDLAAHPLRAPMQRNAAVNRRTGEASVEALVAP